MLWLQLIEARERKGWTQAQLGEKVGVTEYTVFRWEHREAKPRSKYLLKLMEVLGVDEFGLGLIYVPMTTQSQEQRVDLCDTMHHRLFIPIYQ